MLKLATSRRTPSKHRKSLHCESLEDRRVLATMVGTEAELNTALAGVDTCIVLTSDINLTAPVVVARNVTIDGDGFSLISGGLHRVLDVSDGDGIADSITVDLANITITGGGGVGAGAGINSAEILNLTNVNVTGNVAEQVDVNFVAVGGGIATSGTLTLDSSIVSGNTATTPAGDANNAYGGGIAAEGPYSSITLLNGSEVSNNVAKRSGGGLSLREGSLTIDGSSVTGNTAGVGINPDVGTQGGGIYVSGAGPDGYGGTSYTPVSVSISNANISGNDLYAIPDAASTFPHGGGLAVFATGTVDIDGTTISGNTINSGVTMLYSRGGGMAIVSERGDGGMLELTVNNSNVDDNESRDAGGVYTRASVFPASRRLE